MLTFYFDVHEHSGRSGQEAEDSRSGLLLPDNHYHMVIENSSGQMADFFKKCELLTL